jgi:hypothetical protein
MTVQIFQPVGGGGGLTIGSTAITGGTTTRLLFDAAGVVSETDGATWDATNKAFTIGGATVTTSNPVLNLSQTWNAGAVTFTALKLNVTNTASAAASLLLDLQLGGTSQFKVTRTGNLTFGDTVTSELRVNGQYLEVFTGLYDMIFSPAGTRTAQMKASYGLGVLTGDIGFAPSVVSAQDTRITKVAAGILGVRAGSSTAGAALSMVEQTAPSAPAANGVYIYAEDNGAGKTRLMALFASGAAQQIAIEP